MDCRNVWNNPTGDFSSLPEWPVFSLTKYCFAKYWATKCKTSFSAPEPLVFGLQYWVWEYGLSRSTVHKLLLFWKILIILIIYFSSLEQSCIMLLLIDTACMFLLNCDNWSMHVAHSYRFQVFGTHRVHFGRVCHGRDRGKADQLWLYVWRSYVTYMSIRSR